MNPKIIQPSMVDFAAEAPALPPQELEQAVSAAPVPGVTEDWARENMSQLTDKITPLLETLYVPASSSPNGMNDLHYSYGDERALFPYSIRLEVEGGRRSHRKLVFGAAPASFVRDILTNLYGPEIADSGIFEACGLDKETISDFNPLIQYAPEFRQLDRMNGKLVKLVSNAYLSVLALPVEHRPFFTGALLRKQAQSPSSGDMWGGYDRDEYVKPLTLKDVLEYAKEVKRVPKVKEYMDLYMRLA